MQMLEYFLHEQSTLNRNENNDDDNDSNNNLKFKDNCGVGFTIHNFNIDGKLLLLCIDDENNVMI